MKEGKNLIIKKITIYIGFKVLDLKMSLFENFELGNLKLGYWKVINKLKI